MNTENWNEFRSTGLFLFVNVFLHIFGWAILLDIDEGTGDVVSVYPARVNYSGFNQDSMDRAYDRIKSYINIKEKEEVVEEEISDDEETAEEKLETLKINTSEELAMFLKKIQKYKDKEKAELKENGSR